jgi:hypothetical protein
VIEIAKQAAELNGKNIADYKKPQVSYSRTPQKTWGVFFDGRVPMYGNHFSVSVNDETGEARYSGGL